VKWPWSDWLRRLRPNGSTSEARQWAEADRDRIIRRRPLVEQRAKELADLSDEEFAAKVAQMFKRRPA
jgi:hypothetical protein